MVKTPRLQAMYEDLLKQKETILAELKPFRDDYEQLTNHPRLIECRTKIKELNAKLFPIEQEIAALARSLGAQTLSKN